MKVYDLQNANKVVEVTDYIESYRVLPDNSIVLTNAFFNWNFEKSFENLTIAVKQIPRQYHMYIFLDGSYDPVLATNDEIAQMRSVLQQQFPKSKYFFLSGNCEHYSSETDIVWFPFFLLKNHPEYLNQPRNKRVGCLNRRNAPHRVWLMHKLISAKLIDHERDIFSVSFSNIHNNAKCDLSAWLPEMAPVNAELLDYPDQMATVDDGFINDHSIEHPAWNTALTIVTETEPGKLALITEKTTKAFVAKCCWILYTGQSELDVLTDLGFDITTFPNHATGKNIAPIVQMCRELDNESIALDYYHSKLDIIEHNSEWLKFGWYNRYIKKFNSIVD